jgi:hypothetical protein
MSKSLLEKSIKIENLRHELTKKTVYQILGDRKKPEADYKSDVLALKLHD